MNADLKDSLTRAFRTNASVTNNNAADSCIVQATSYWLEQNKNRPWHIITVDLTLSAHHVSSVATSMMTQKNLGILKRSTLTNYAEPNTLVIYSSDRYTEQWVHDWVQARADGPSSRILNVQRDDQGPVIDLGIFNPAG